MCDSGENLRDWLRGSTPTRTEIPAKPKRMYKSKHNPDPQLVKSSFNPKVITDEYPTGKRVKNKPMVPRRDQVTQRSTLRGGKNFVMANAIQAILKGSEPKREESRVDYLKKKEYGKAPKYLNRVKAEIAREKDALNAYLRAREEEEQEAKHRERELSEEDRAQLLEKLKDKWDDLNREYQKQAHVVQLDTSGKIKRKEHLESMMRKVEAAIENLEKGPVVICS